MVDKPSLEKTQILDANVLSGWKDIASHLGKSVRTVQRYERHFGLPVRRPSEGSLGSVMAVKVELDQWVNSCPRHTRGSPGKLTSQLQTSQKLLVNNLVEMGRLRAHGWALGGQLMESVTRLKEDLRRSREAQIEGNNAVLNRRIS